MKCQLALCAPVIYAALIVFPAVLSATPHSLEVNHTTNYYDRDCQHVSAFIWEEMGTT